jgi:hypothetical protein
LIFRRVYSSARKSIFVSWSIEQEGRKKSNGAVQVISSS